MFVEQTHLSKILNDLYSILLSRHLLHFNEFNKLNSHLLKLKLTKLKEIIEKYLILTTIILILNEML